METLKVSKFQNEFMKSSKNERNIVRIFAHYMVWHSTGQKSLQFLVETMTS